MRISKKLGIQASQYELDFLDVDFDKDSPLYIDPFLISNSNSQWAIHTDFVIKNFFNEFKTAMIKNDYKTAKELFLYMSEPKENCLGVSRKGTTNGKGVGSLNAQNIVDKIIESNAIENNLVNNIEDLIIFVNDIDRDKLSDMVTNIIRKSLIDYTKHQCYLWNIKLTHGETLPYWNATKREWVYSEDDLLIIDNREILLIPKAIVSPINIYDISTYKWYFVIEQEREFHIRRRSSLVKVKKLKNGKTKLYLPKKDVDEDIRNQISKGLFFNTKDYIRDYTLKYPELFSQFVQQSKTSITSLNNEEILSHIEDLDINEIIEKLVNRLKSIPTGKNNASEYHHYIKSLLEILWYPYLINPIIELEILDGRKRIDIVMDNNAKSGFFYNMMSITKIFSPYIFVECKNYGHDIANPEIDQLSGRFSLHRGQFGILVCRDINDEMRFLKRCQDTYKDGRGLVIYLTDNDIITMFEFIKNNNADAMWKLMDNKKRQVILS